MKQIFIQSRHLLLLAGICILIGSGCKKDNSNGPDSNTTDSYISFKADGVQKKYTNQALASLGYATQDKLYNAVLQGYPDPGSADKGHIGLFIFDNNAVAPGTYHDPQKAANADGDKITKVMINYYDDANKGYLSMGAMVDEDGNPLPGLNGIIADAQVTITKLTSSSIEGTFSGTITDATLADKIVITEGKFRLKRIQ